MSKFKVNPKKIFAFITGIAIVVSMFSPLSLSMAQSNSAGGELTAATIAGAASTQHVGTSSTAAHRTVAWTRTGYTGAVNIYYARESVNPGYCTAPDPATQGAWNATSGSGIVTSDFVWGGAEIGALLAGTDYCLLIRDAGSSGPWAVTDQFEIDNTVPAISTRQTQDLNGNGKIDAIKVTMNDEILDSTIAIGDFATSHAEDLDIDYTNTIGGIAFVNGIATGTANDTVFYLKLNEHATVDTETLPTLTYTAGGLTDLADNALVSNGPTATTDLAKPVITNAQWLDATADGNIDRVILTFSEQVDVADGNGGDGLDSIVINDGASVTIDAADYVRTDQTTLTLNFTGDPITGTGITGLTVTYSDAGANAITDNAAGTPNEIVNGDVAEVYADGALPVFLSSTTADLDGNGTVDQVTIVYSEAVSIVDAAGGAFDGVTFGDTCTAAAADYSSVSTTSSVVALTGCTAGNTAITADPTYAAAAGAIIDLSAALNEMANAETVTGTDGAAPAIISSAGLDATGDGKTDSYTITFSENLTDKGAAAANANFTARNATTTNAITIDTVGIGLTAGGGATKVTLNLNVADTDNYTGIIDFSYNSAGGGAIIEDASAGTVDYGNKTNVAFTDDVLPVLLSSRGGNIGGDADVLNAVGEILDFVFSEPMNAVVPTIVQLEAGLTFANGAVDGTNLGGGTNTVTRVTTSITGDTYRVTHVDTDSTNPITPGTDTVQVTLGTNIKDTTGNIANTVPAAVTVAVADIAPPTFTSRETQDLDADGKIDAIKITMNEAIIDSTITIANFTTSHAELIDATYTDTIGGIVFVNGVATGATPDDTIFYIKLGEHATGDTDATPTLTYTAGTLTDASNNLAVTTGAVATTDKSAPAAMSAVYKDTGVADGQVDTIEITFSEAVTLTAYADGDWSVSTPGTVIALADETNATAATNVITLTALGAANKTGGGTNPEITYTAGTNVNDGVILGNNTATFTIAATDDAAPFVASKKYLDQNGDGHVDQVELTLTENQTTCTALVTDFAYVAQDITNSDLTGGSIACATNKVTLTLGTVGNANITSHTTAPTIAYGDDAAREISDVGGHQLATFAVGNLADGAGPVVTAVREFDMNGDGKVDETMLTYSESISDASVAAADYTIGGTAADTKLDATSTNGIDTNAANDAVITISVAAGVTGTGKKAVAYTAGTTTDAGSNLAPSQTFLAADATDSAKPIITAVREFDMNGDGKVDETMLTFSESIDDSTVVAADYTIGGTAADTKLDTTSTNAIDTNTPDDTVITISVAAGVTGTAKKAVVYTAGTTADLNTNTAITQTFASGGVTDSAKPIITAVREFDVSGDGKVDETMLTFSESISDASVTASEYTIGGTAADTKLDAASTNGIDTNVANDAVITISVAAGVTGTEKKAVTYTPGTTADLNAIEMVAQSFAALGVTDSAAPIPLTTSINKAISGNNLQNGSVISVTFSEEVTPLAVADNQWKFSRNGFEAVAAANWPDGSTIAYGSGATNNIVTMTLTGATTGTAWMNGAKLNLNADNTASITDATGNQADMKDADIVISGMNGPAIDYVGTSAITSSSVTVGWTTNVVTTGNRVIYDTKANFDGDHTLDQQSTAGAPGEGTLNHSVNLSGLTASTIYYYAVCSINNSESCTSGQFTTSAASDLIAPAGLAITTADATVNSDYYTIGGTITVDANDVTIQVLKGSDVVGTVIVTAGETVWSVVVPLAQTVANTFTARATDPTGNPALSTANADPLLQSVVITENATVGTDITAPVVTGQAPDVGDTGVSINPEDLYVQFDEALDPTTIGSSNVLLCLVSDATCAIPVAVGSPNLLENGTMIRIGGPSVTLSYNTPYWVKITTGVKNLAGIALATTYGSTTTSNFTTGAAPTGTLSVDNIRINPAKSYAVNDNDFDSGWEWYVSLTLPTSDPKVRLKFSDFAGAVGSIPATGDNIRYYSADDTNGHTTEGTAVNVATVDTYPGDYLIFNAGSDEQLEMDGYQVVVKVQVKVPVAATGGSYAGQFKVEATH
ncbi:MAG: Ig-like domain-containing protein [Candidatus Paceibacterota bacterium]